MVLICPVRRSFNITRILITSGPTRQYLDPVRYLSNGSSGQMGNCLAGAAIAQGHDVVIVTGPVSIEYPQQAKTIRVVTTAEMLDAASEEFKTCDGVIAVAAPCDYQPRQVSDQKLQKTGGTLKLELIETPDIMATLGKQKRPDQWSVAFALETEQALQRATEKLHRKNCDLIVLNTVSAIDAQENSIDIIANDGRVIESTTGPKTSVAETILTAIKTRLIDQRSGQ